ncbi:hypothetical protein [Nostoc sp. C117]|uniref:hypothetical protein n=1 Tax=Nostoc sp. C117 TaxID=3349875 RepID=UPI00370DDE36
MVEFPAVERLGKAILFRSYATHCDRSLIGYKSFGSRYLDISLSRFWLNGRLRAKILTLCIVKGMGHGALQENNK